MARILAIAALVAAVVVVVVVVSNATSGDDDGTKGGNQASKQQNRGGKGGKKGAAKVYVVQDGDTLSAIADKTGVELTTLQELNPTVDPQALIAGEKLKLR